MANPYQITDGLNTSIENYQNTTNKLITLRKILRYQDNIIYKIWNLTHDEINVSISFMGDIPTEFILKLSNNDVNFQVKSVKYDDGQQRQTIII